MEVITNTSKLSLTHLLGWTIPNICIYLTFPFQPLEMIIPYGLLCCILEIVIKRVIWALGEHELIHHWGLLLHSLEVTLPFVR